MVSKPNLTKDVTMVEEIKTPIIIAKVDLCFERPIRFAAKAPVHTPVNGNGRLTKKIKP